MPAAGFGKLRHSSCCKRTTDSSAVKVAHSLRECGQLAERVAYRVALAAQESIITDTIARRLQAGRAFFRHRGEKRAVQAVGHTAVFWGAMPAWGWKTCHEQDFEAALASA